MAVKTLCPSAFVAKLNQLNKLKLMKKIACFALLAVLFTNCKKDNSEQKLEPVKTPAVTDTVSAIKEDT
ncbi:MAG TPA: hypothetical protein VFQ56_10820, partial [Flavobacterium sp.]|nr:hypothetical protein [Flavobacterium sp.]